MIFALGVAEQTFNNACFSLYLKYELNLAVLNEKKRLYNYYMNYFINPCKLNSGKGSV